MEMSRQRLRTGVLEASTKTCAHCEGTGLMRTASSSGLSALRIIEDEAARGRGEHILLRAGREAAIYVLNKKRAELAEIDERYGVAVEVMIDEAFEGARMSVESSGARPEPQQRLAAAPIVEDDDFDYEDEVEEQEAESSEEERDEPRSARTPRDGDEEDGAPRKRRRRRGGRGRNRRDGEPEREAGDTLVRDEADDRPDSGDEVPVLVEGEHEREAEQPDDTEGEERPRSRRGRRGGRGRRGRSDGANDGAGSEVEAESSPATEILPAADLPAAAPDGEPDFQAPKARRRPRARRASEPAAAEAAVIESVETAPEPLVEAVAVAGEEEAPPAAVKADTPKRRSRAKKADGTAQPSIAPAQAGVGEAVVAELAGAETGTVASNDGPTDDESGGLRRGWWQRTFG